MRAPAAGLVRHVRDGEPDGPIGSWQFLRAAGNHVVIEVAPSEFLFIAHLRPGSIAVAPGDHVVQGVPRPQPVRLERREHAAEPAQHRHQEQRVEPVVGQGPRAVDLPRCQAQHGGHEAGDGAIADGKEFVPADAGFR